MHIIVNDAPVKLDAPCTVVQLLNQLNVAPNGLAVAINNSVLVKRLWQEYQLQPDDTVQIFQLVTGG